MNLWLLASWHLTTYAKSWGLLVLFYVECALIGLVLSRYLRRWCTPMTWPACALLGGLMAGSLAQVISFFGGLQYGSNYVILVWLVIDTAWARAASFQHAACVCRATSWQALGIFVPLSAVISVNALTNAFGTDAGLYHLSEFRWMAEFGTVPGLANLHGRFGFNSVLAAIGGLLSTGFGLAIGREFANPLIVLIASAVATERLRWSSLRLREPVSVLRVAAIPALVTMAFADSLSSPQADVASAAMAVAAGVLLGQRVLVSEPDPRTCNTASLELLASLLLLVELKLAYIFFALGCGIVLLWLETKRSPSHGLAIGAAALVILLPYLTRGYILSGYPLYPLEFGALPLDWAVPRSAVRMERIWVSSWARRPRTPWQEVMANSDWLGPWLRHSLAEPILGRPLLLGALGAAILGMGLFRNPPLNRETKLLTIVMLPPLFGLIGWFITSPDPRFAEGTFWALAASVSALAVSVNRGRSWVIVLSWSAIAALVLAETEAGCRRLSREPKRLPNWVGSPSVGTQRVTRSGLHVWVPTKTQIPGDGPLPGTIPDRFDPALELRGETLRNGFRTQDKRFSY